MSFAKFLLLINLVKCEVYLASVADKNVNNIFKNNVKSDCEENEQHICNESQKKSLSNLQNDILKNISEIIPKKKVGNDYQDIPVSRNYGFKDYNDYQNTDEYTDYTE